MKTIWKYTFEVQDVVRLEMPKGARILSHAERMGPSTISVWAEVDPKQEREMRRLCVQGTGNPLNPDALGAYVGTVNDPPMFVWHVYESAA